MHNDPDAVCTDGGLVPESTAGDRRAALPDVVVTFGGESKVYHRPDEGDDPQAACGTPGRNPTDKRRTLIESHYRPCRKSPCFPNADGDRDR